MIETVEMNGSIILHFFCAARETNARTFLLPESLESRWLLTCQQNAITSSESVTMELPGIKHSLMKFATASTFPSLSLRLPSFRPMAMDSPTAFCSNFSSFFMSFVYTHRILLFILLFYHRSVLLIRLKSFLDFFLSFFHPKHQNIQAILVIEEHQNQELFRFIHTYITYKLLPSAGGAIKITKPKHSITLTSRVDEDQEIPDSFRGVQLKWVLRVKQKNGFIGQFRKTRYFQLYVPQKHLAEVRTLYLQSHVLEEAGRIRRNNMILRRRLLQHQQRRNGARAGWIPVIAGLLIQLIGCC